jgi:hypothetical protein
VAGVEAAEGGGVMEAFTLDTSGAVSLPAPLNYVGALQDSLVLWSDLTPFQQGYVEAQAATLALCPGVAHGGHRAPTEADGGVFPCSRCGVPIVTKGGANTPVLRFDMWAPETLAAILRDCEARMADQPRLGDKARDGTLFWADRQAGFACTGDGEPIPPLTPYLGDDGRVYLREGQ